MIRAKKEWAFMAAFHVSASKVRAVYEVGINFSSLGRLSEFGRALTNFVGKDPAESKKGVLSSAHPNSLD